MAGPGINDNIEAKKQSSMTVRKQIGASRSVQRTPGIEYNEDPRVEQLVFICGLHRCGTSLLEHILVSELDLSCLRMNVSENEGQHAQSVYSPAFVFGGPGRFAFSADMQRELGALCDYENHRKAILSDWASFVVGSSATMIEKSPPNLTKIWWLRSVFPGARFIILARDPRAVAGATRKWSRTSLEELMMHWHVAYSAALKDFRPDDCIAVKYEDFTANPESTVDRIAHFLAIGRRPAVLTISDRFKKMSNSNDEYIAMHGGRTYGRGAWNGFGYV